MVENKVFKKLFWTSLLVAVMTIVLNLLSIVLILIGSGGVKIVNLLTVIDLWFFLLLLLVLPIGLFFLAKRYHGKALMILSIFCIFLALFGVVTLTIGTLQGNELREINRENLLEVNRGIDKGILEMQEKVNNKIGGLAFIAYISQISILLAGFGLIILKRSVKHSLWVGICFIASGVIFLIINFIYSIHMMAISFDFNGLFYKGTIIFMSSKILYILLLLLFSIILYNQSNLLEG